MKNNALILLSGGLDSFVALDIISKKYNVKLALTFDYGQKALDEELKASKEICNVYKINQIVVKLPFLADITKNALTQDGNDNLNDLKSVWVANRNGLFLNIAACYCEEMDIQYIAFGANKEESGSFSDNKKEYVDIATESFKYSTMTHPVVLAPCSDYTKVDLVNYMIDNNLSFDLIKSCYRNFNEKNKKHCGECMSCKLLKNAVLKSKKPELIKEIF